ncbi:MAG: cob(I)yrinic acid a,c-diamide adenosyltransferase [Pyrobaculum sp.]
MRLAFYGGGKGKTSAALGVALRAWGHGMKVLYAGVLKTPVYMGEEVGEYKAMKRMGIDVIYLSEFKKPQAVLDYVISNAEKYDLVILDELLYAVRQGFINSRHVAMGVETHVVATGNYWIDEFINYFDLVTRLDNVKHYYATSRIAVRGLDW